MEVQMSPAPLFNGNSPNMICGSAKQPQQQSFEPPSKRFKSDLTFQCIVCSDVYDDPNILYEHMKKQHEELYEHSEDVSGGENGFDSDSEHELSDEEYLDLSRLLEPICELRQDDDEKDDEPQVVVSRQPPNVLAQLMENHAFGMAMNEEHLRLQLQLQAELQNRLLQLQMTGMMEQSNQSDKQHRSRETPLTLRKLLNWNRLFFWRWD